MALGQVFRQLLFYNLVGLGDGFFAEGFFNFFRLSPKNKGRAANNKTYGLFLEQPVQLCIYLVYYSAQVFGLSYKVQLIHIQNN